MNAYGDTSMDVAYSNYLSKYTYEKLVIIRRQSTDSHDSKHHTHRSNNDEGDFCNRGGFIDSIRNIACVKTNLLSYYCDFYKH
jgi:hypothetical protein